MIEQGLEKAVVTRRRFFSWGIGAIVAATAGVLSVPVARYLAHPALQEQSSNWTLLAPVTEIKLGQPSLFKVSIENNTGWLKTTWEASVYVDSADGKSFTVLSNTCTHLGCPVRWDSGRQSYLCPCHNGVFDREGNVVGGPPPRPLDRFKTRVDSGKLYIMGG